MPAIETWTVGVGLGAEFHFPTTPDIWCGDMSYPAPVGGSPPPEQEGFDRLFSILDIEYNQLIDALGDKVVILAIRNDAGTVDAYRTGFVVTPRITFRTVDPVTGVVRTSPYTIQMGRR